jgi:hypothetical protein
MALPSSPGSPGPDVAATAPATAAPPGPPPAGAVGAPAPSGDWATQTTDTIVRFVEQARDRTTVPLLTAGRGLVFGILAAIVGITALVLALVLVLRLLDLFLPVWASYLVLGILLVIVGAVLMRLRRQQLEAV